MRVKLTTFVPLDYADTVREALGAADAGMLGEYSYCSFSTNGVGRFKPSAKANPNIGNREGLSAIEEERIEVTCDRIDAKKIIAALKNTHPYEEVAFDIVAIIDEQDL